MTMRIEIDGWSVADLHTLIMTAGEIMTTYGFELDRDDVLSTRQKTVLIHARRDYHRANDEPDAEYLGTDDEGGEHFRVSWQPEN
jgi:hypothetical protein